MGRERSILGRALGIEAKQDHIRFDVQADRAVFCKQSIVGVSVGAKTLEGRGSIFISLEEIAYRWLANFNKLQGSP